MKPDLAKQLLKDIIEPLVGNNEAEAERIFNELHFLAEYKYDYYEMYSPGRHFLENFYKWINQFKPQDREVALDLVRKHLIFISRGEFELLTRVLYWENVRKIQFDVAAKVAGIPRYKVKLISQSPELKKIERSSLYIGMSDGARIDYFRRQNPAIGNEQVLTSYHVDHHKCAEMIQKLEAECGVGSRFRLVFLIDDFCASGTTLIRAGDAGQVKGTLSQLAGKTFPQKIGDKIEEPTMLSILLSTESEIYLCHLLATGPAVRHIEENKSKLPPVLASLNVAPVAILSHSIYNNPQCNQISKLCMSYYQKRMGDEHTGDVMLGYRDCGLFVVLHHNTPNNSLYLLWNRRATKSEAPDPAFHPLFMRIERHRSIKS